MAGALALAEVDGGAEWRRWTVAAVFVLAAHVGLASIYWLTPQPEAEGSAAAPAVIVELAPVPASPASQQDLAPGPEMVEAQPTPKPPEQTEPEVEATLPMVEMPAEVTLPKPEPKPEPKAAEKKPEENKDRQKSETEVMQENIPAPRTTAAPRSVQETAAAPAAPNPGSASSRAAITQWSDLMMARLQQNKRYPQDARARHEQGVVMLSFIVDRAGHVLERSIAKSSGFAALDEEVLAMVKRAEPLPAFPPAMVRPEIHLTVPIRFRVQ
jgi:protein TonB